MEFTTKDLLVTVLPKPELNKEVAKFCLFRTVICRYPTWQCPAPSLLCGIRCSFLPTLCSPCTKIISLCNICSLFISEGPGCRFFASCGGPGGSACDPTYFCFGTHDPYVIQHLEDLVTLKAELQATLKSLDALQKELPSALGSKQEAEALERGLTEALEQVRTAKKGL
jgi:hypothetical protein